MHWQWLKNFFIGRQLSFQKLKAKCKLTSREVTIIKMKITGGKTLMRY